MKRDNNLIKIECNLDEKVKNVIEKYRKKSYDREPQLKFMYIISIVILDSWPYVEDINSKFEFISIK